MKRYLANIERALRAHSPHSAASLSLAAGKFTVLEGQWHHPRTVIIEFPAREAAEGWYKSADYQKIIGLRLQSSSGNLVIVDGI